VGLTDSVRTRCGVPKVLKRLRAEFLGEREGEARFAIDALPESNKASLSQSRRHRNRASRARQRSDDRWWCRGRRRRVVQCGWRALAAWRPRELELEWLATSGIGTAVGMTSDEKDGWVWRA